jgi:hypothetical protein
MKLALEALEFNQARWQGKDEALEALRTALAAPCLEVTVDPRLTPDEAAAISSALAAPRPEPVAFTRKEWSPDCGEYVEFRTVEEMKFYDRTDWTPLYAAPPEPDATHPGYIIGSHWLETAYSRICAGEAEADVLRDCGWERVTDAEALRRDAERYRYLRNRDPKEVFGKSGEAAGVWIDWEDDMAGLQLLTGDDADAAIDAAIGDKT